MGGRPRGWGECPREGAPPFSRCAAASARRCAATRAPPCPPPQELWLRDAAKLRARFDASASATPAAAERLLREGEEEALRATHPDMYTVSYMPGGSKFMRNPPLPLGVR